MYGDNFTDKEWEEFCRRWEKNGRRSGITFWEGFFIGFYISGFAMVYLRAWGII